MTSNVDCSTIEADSCPTFPWFVGNNVVKTDNSNYGDSVKVPEKNIAPPAPIKKPVNCVWQYQEYVNYVDRIASFQDWPKYLRGPNTRDLARAGFVYTQIGDKVTCFCCGMTLKNWEPFDDAYKEHLRWSKNCTYANMVSDGQ